MRIIKYCLFIICFFCVSSFAHAENLTADYVVVKKSARAMFLIKNRKIIKAYRISLGPKSKGRKLHQGDNKTPEGIYKIDKANPNSKYFYGLHISYPNETDKKIASILKLRSGGDIYIHGLPNQFPDAYAFAGRDWTRGCIAVNNHQMKEIVRMVPIGTTIEILP